MSAVDNLDITKYKRPERVVLLSWERMHPTLKSCAEQEIQNWAGPKHTETCFVYLSCTQMARYTTQSVFSAN